MRVFHRVGQPVAAPVKFADVLIGFILGVKHPMLNVAGISTDNNINANKKYKCEEIVLESSDKEGLKTVILFFGCAFGSPRHYI